MTISEEESIFFCACHLLICDEGKGQCDQSQAFGTKVQEKKEKREPSRVSNLGR
jgi:hypothetical protein